METSKPHPTQTNGDSLHNDGIKVKRRKIEQECATTSTNGSVVKEAKKSIGRFLYESGMDFNVVQLPSFQSMISLNSGVTKDQIPTSQELQGWIFKEAMDEMREYVDEMRKSWANTGCSVLLDGWTDAKGRRLIIVLVDCPRGTIYLRSFDISDYCFNKDAMLIIDEVVNDVGVENIVQIITSSASGFMKELGKRVMEKYRPIFWTLSLSCCIDLMLERMGNMDIVKETLDKAKIIVNFIHSQPEVVKILHDHTDGRDLVNPSKIKSALPFLALENIVSEGESLKKMFLLDNSILNSTTEGKRVAAFVGSRSFWSAAKTVLKAAFPIVRVMELMNEKKSQMDLIYETIDQAKETISKGFNSKKEQYKPYWEVIDEVWSGYLYSPLHTGGYYLNPSLFYSDDFYMDPEVVTGLICCFVRATNDPPIQDKLVSDLVKFQKGKGAFNKGSADDVRSNVPPALWWSEYGGECPELQRLAVRILNQTCDGASKFPLNRSLVENLFNSGENQMKQQRLIDLAFLNYNLLLQSFVPDHSTSYDPMDDWVLSTAQKDETRKGWPLDTRGWETSETTASLLT